MATLVGKTLGKYTITERLGKGGMAEVYKARHPKLDRLVTIKVLHSYLAEGEDFLARFEREARAVASLRHPHIVQIHDFDVDDDRYYMVMEFIDGGTLQARLNELSKAGRYMPAGEVLSILGQVAEALDYAHKQGILHRDIKPSNIMLDTAGNAFLTDFGIARMMGGTQFTTTGSLIGTPTYMSPEQGKGLELGDASDIYSLGVILYELLTGKVPFSADTPLAIIHQHVNDPLPAPHLLRPDLPAAVEQVVTKALEKDPRKRYQTAQALCQALEKALSKETIARLDEAGAQAAAPRTAMPTLRVDEAAATDRAALPTAMMGEGTRLEIEGPGRGSRPARPKAAAKKETPPPPAKVARPAPERKPATAGLVGWVKARPVVAGLIAVAVIAILVIILTSLSGGASCADVTSCIGLKDQRMAQGDMGGALDALNAAIDHVAPQDHPMYAFLWCDRATLLEGLGRIDEANTSRQTCSAWQSGQ